MSETKDDVEEDSDYETSSSDDNETLSVDPPFYSSTSGCFLRLFTS